MEKMHVKNRVTGVYHTCAGPRLGQKQEKLRGGAYRCLGHSSVDPSISVLHDNATAQGKDLIKRKAPTVGHGFKCGLAGSETWNLGGCGWDIWVLEGVELCSKHSLGGVNVGETGGEKSGRE